MNIEFSPNTTTFNTQYAPLCVLLSLYNQNELLKPLEIVTSSGKTVDFSTTMKLEQILVSILAGCETLVEVNNKLKGDIPLIQVGGWPRIADQSTLSLALDGLSLMNIAQLREATTQILQFQGATPDHDWRGFLWLDFDLSGLPAGKQAEGSEKGFFSGKKTSEGGN